MGMRTYSWIARQDYSIRYYDDDKILVDGSIAAERFNKEFGEFKEPYEEVFKRGHLWPSIILVERTFEENDTVIEIFIRVYKQKFEAIVDFYIGNDMDIVTDYSQRFSVPIYRLSTSRKGKRGSVKKILDFYS